MIGSELQNRYVVESELGRGGMGVVYQAKDKLLDRPVAIKIVSASTLSTEGRSRLLLEAQAAAKISHPNVVTIFDVGQTMIGGSEGMSSFIVMELISGVMLRDGPPEDVKGTAEIARQIIAALSEAHDRGIIHRDLKPENIMVTPSGLVKLTDFGLAQIVGGARLTQEGVVMGTLAYMAPEIILGQEATPQTDLYSFGIVLYELLAGQTPFAGDSPTAILSQHIHAPVVPPSTHNSRVPPAADNLVLQLLRKQPTDRPASAREVAGRLEIWVNQDPAYLESTTSPQLSRLIRGRMVGREGEFTQAIEAWQQAVGGNNQALLISGEPGIGKSRFAQELLTYAELSGGMVLSGRCYQEGAAPFAPLKEIIRSSLSEVSDLELPANVMADLLSLVPDQRQGYPDLRFDLEATQERLFDSIVALCQVLSQRRPLLLFIDDLHWADSGSLGFFRYLARRASGWSLLLVTTYREAELTTRRPAQKMLRDLELEGLARRIRLQRLDIKLTRALLSTLFAEEISGALAESIFQETEGNPFFVEEVSRALVDSGELFFREGGWHRSPSSRLVIPENVQMAIGSRLDNVPAEDLSVLQTAALLGRHFKFDTLLAVGDYTEDLTIEALEKAEQLQLVQEEVAPNELRQAPHFAFSHALVHSVLISMLSTLRRQRLQLKVARRLEETFPDGLDHFAPLLANYFGEAGQVDKAVTYLIMAGDLARNMFAFSEAIESYEQAMLLLREGNDVDLGARTLMKLGLMYHNHHQFEEARRVYNEAFDLQRRGAKMLRPETGQIPEAPHPYRDHRIEPPSLDPAVSASSESEAYIQLLFSGLVYRHPSGEIVPDSALSWNILDGGVRYIFHLRDDVKWSDGRPVTAVDFEFAWKRVLSPQYGESPASLFYDIVGARAYNHGEITDGNLIGVQAMNDRTLRVQLIEPAAHFIQILSQGMAFPIPSHIVSEDPDWADPDKIVTNGPFQVKAWFPGEGTILERYPGYHGRFQGNVIEIESDFTNTSLMPAKYAADELDTLEINLLRDEDQLQVMRRFSDDYISEPSPFTGYYWVDVNRPPMGDKRVRQALSLAINRENIVDNATRGLVYPATGGVVPPAIPGHVPNIAITQDPEAARRLLAQAGYPAGDGLPHLTIITGRVPIWRAITEELARQWEDVLSIRVDVLSLPSSDLRQRWLSDPPHAWMLGWTADYPDPYNFLNDASWRPIGGWHHEAYDRLIQNAWRCADLDERLALYAQAEQILIEEAPVVPLAYVRIHLLIKPWIKNWQLVGTFEPFFPDLVIEPH